MEAPRVITQDKDVAPQIKAAGTQEDEDQVKEIRKEIGVTCDVFGCELKNKRWAEVRESPHIAQVIISNFIVLDDVVFL